MLIQQIDVIGFQSTQRTLNGESNTFGPAVQSLLCIVGADGEAEFCGDHDLIANWRQRFADNLLIEIGAVELGGIEERDT
ncbi:hypothetical protein A221_17647 [Pseudomonas syringae pv. actinidiae ICMP 18801]|nr:hypothetical protein A3SM_21387 [Pseudomonas syringae pv. actinidiae ICMP 18886]EPN64647.1 hypothetical protein A235_14571 [Pseudomonas syringae pv. actinidiae ICMP 19079]EPN71019.1 hypothetical protein A234_21692 [Pseudomonas syringae pv. actinidiae ICMP 19101]EPN78334.1 hypothetical protein A233_10891 [Pseudomonas syringae pv. actinidiae ICMP 19097]EPN79326.1 hypothetical protein A221_17647 [Pseudomonas syringae pv. actinidiae ICMP 18801]OSS12938.1 hypothetical protein BV336_05538 [Pseudo